jgi:nucleoside-diphosphate-sugar epimerase
VSWKAYSEAMFAALGSKKRPTSLPLGVAYAAAAAMTLWGRAIRSRERPPLTLYPVEQGSRDYHFSNAKARGLLGFEPRIFHEEGLAITARAYLKDRAGRGERK